jgi:hypothetical protein
VTFSDTQTKRNLVVGQICFQGANGELVAGPNLQTVGLVSHSVSLGPVSVSQPDITLGEFLNVIGASYTSCGASLLSRKVGDDNAGWFRAEQNKPVGEEVSLLLEDVRNEIAEPKSLVKLYRRDEGRGTDWSGQSAPNSPVSK